MNVLNRIAPLPAQKLLLGISLFFWCGAMHFYWPNNGGSGLSLPLNITSWIYAVVLAASALMLAHHCASCGFYDRGVHPDVALPANT